MSNPSRNEAGSSQEITRETGATELELRRSVWRLLARELSEPSEEFVSFISARLDQHSCAGPGSEPLTVDELTRRALQEFAGQRWAARERRSAGERQAARASLRGRGRVPEAGSLPGYYLG